MPSAIAQSVRESALPGEAANEHACIVMIRCTIACVIAGKKNGVQRVWLDGEKVFENTDVLYTNTNEHQIEKFVFQNFHGGKSDNFRPDKTQHQWCGPSRMVCKALQANGLDARRHP
jgi:hypothetical protein